MTAISADDAADHELERHVLVGAQGRRSALAGPGAAAEIGEAPLEAVPDRGQRAEQADDAASGHRAGADVEHVGAADVVGAHLRDRHGAGRDHAGRDAAEVLDRRDQHQVGEHAAGAHDRGDARADDVADAEQRGIDLGGDRAGLEGLPEDLLGGLLPQVEDLHHRLVDEADAEAGEDGLGAGGARLGGGGGVPGLGGGAGGDRPLLGRGAGLQHLGAGGPLGVLEEAVLLDDERPAQRDHHQDPQQAAEHRDQHHPRDLEVEAEDHDRRHGDADAEGDRLAGRPGRLHDVVLEDRRPPEPEPRGARGRW